MSKLVLPFSCVSLAFLLAAYFNSFLMWEYCYRFNSHPLVAWILPTCAFVVWAVLCLLFGWFERLVTNYRSWVPFVLLAFALMVLVVRDDGNDASLWLRYNTWQYGEARADIFRRLNAGERFQAGQSYAGNETIHLPDGPMLAIGRTDPWIKRTDKGTMVYFHTFHGIPDGVQGFVYAPNGVDLRAAWPGLEAVEIDLIGTNPRFYFVGSR